MEFQTIYILIERLDNEKSTFNSSHFVISSLNILFIKFNTKAIDNHCLWPAGIQCTKNRF